LHDWLLRRLGGSRPTKATERLHVESEALLYLKAGTEVIAKNARREIKWTGGKLRLSESKRSGEKGADEQKRLGQLTCEDAGSGLLGGEPP